MKIILVLVLSVLYEYYCKEEEKFLDAQDDPEEEKYIDAHDDSDEKNNPDKDNKLVAVNFNFTEEIPLNEEDEDIELPKGDVADLFGTNQHYSIPANYQDLGRRFVLQYPYTEKKTIEEHAENELHNAVKQYLESNENDKELVPVKAPPEFVLDIAQKSAILEGTKPRNPSDKFIQKDILRTGNYWNDVVKEEINPKEMLRSSNTKDHPGSVRVQIDPGSKLYTLVSILKEKSPRLLYVINKVDY